MTQIVLQVEDSKLISAIKQLFSEMKGVKVIEVKKTNKELVNLLEEGEKDIALGKTKTIKTDDLWK